MDFTSAVGSEHSGAGRAEKQDPRCSTAVWPFLICLHHSALLGAIHLEAGQSFPFLVRHKSQVRMSLLSIYKTSL